MQKFGPYIKMLNDKGVIAKAIQKDRLEEVGIVMQGARNYKDPAHSIAVMTLNRLKIAKNQTPSKFRAARVIVENCNKDDFDNFTKAFDSELYKQEMRSAIKRNKSLRDPYRSLMKEVELRMYHGKRSGVTTAKAARKN